MSLKKLKTKHWIIIITILIICFGLYQYFVFIPFEVEKGENGWKKYKNEYLSFEYPRNLRPKIVDRKPLVYDDWGVLTDGYYEIFYSFHGKLGIIGYNNLARANQKTLFELIKQEIGKKYPSLNAIEIDSLVSEEARVVNTINNSSDISTYKVAVVSDTMFIEVNVEETKNLKYITDCCYYIDLEGKFRRRIYYDKFSGYCSLLEKENINNHLILDIKRQRLGVATHDKEKDLGKLGILKVLKTVKLTQGNN